MKVVLRQAGLLLCLALLPASIAAFFHPKKPSWNAPQENEISPSIAASLGSAVLWVDARPHDEYRKNHVPGALSLHPAEWDNSIVPVLQTWTPERIVVVYCSSQDCDASHEVAERLRNQLGLKPVYVLKGGWEAWQAEHK